MLTSSSLLKSGCQIGKAKQENKDEVESEVI